jgi:hypothetical protein
MVAVTRAVFSMGGGSFGSSSRRMGRFRASAACRDASDGEALLAFGIGDFAFSTSKTSRFVAAKLSFIACGGNNQPLESVNSNT